MKKITSEDILTLVLVSIYLTDMDFANLNTLNIIGLIVSLIWLVFLTSKLSKNPKDSE
ncbi:hypothetical protein JOC33_002898 [Thalassobacillus pellis]|nr:hypothetical protein [Thalassobacillus pellis]